MARTVASNSPFCRLPPTMMFSRPASPTVAQSRVFDPRYDEDAVARRGVTSRHIAIGVGLAVAAYLLWRL